MVFSEHYSSNPSAACQSEKLIDISTVLGKQLPPSFLRPIEHFLSLDTLNTNYRNALPNMTKDNFFDQAMSILDVAYESNPDDTSRVPATGPLVVVSNHPFGGVEGVVLGHFIHSVRPDVRIMANYLLQNIPTFRDWVIPVNPFSNAGSVFSSSNGIRSTMRWLRQSHALVVFPSGTVSHFTLKRGGISDPEWSDHISAIILRCKATVLPVYFPGRNSMMFQCAGMINERLRTAMLPREMMNKKAKKIPFFIGAPLNKERLSRFGSPTELTAFLRSQTYFLKNRIESNRRSFSLSNCLPHSLFIRKKRIAISNQRNPLLLDREIETLKADQKLYSKKDMSVYTANAAQIPKIIEEIGRLREITFRAVGEGTGNDKDLDHFDSHYNHIFIWDHTNRKIAGAYRIGQTNTILNRFGLNGLYTNSLFRFRKKFIESMSNSLELGRSFICPEYQKKHGCLDYLWKGIGTYIARNPQYRYLFGPVSISQSYRNVSRNLIIEFLKKNNMHHSHQRYVMPRVPYRSRVKQRWIAQSVCRHIKDVDDLSLFISEIETDGKGVPVLLRYYLRLNASIISFNLDRQFSSVIDGLILVDLTTTPDRFLNRYMGKEGYRRFRDYHSRIFM